MLSRLKNRDEGFTIIEVVIVLAIAGLIFLIVFIAVPQLQRSRRDTQRRNDLARVAAQLESFAANNGGLYPSNAEFETGGDFDVYVPDDEYQDPRTGTTYEREGSATPEDDANDQSEDVATGDASIIYYERLTAGGRAYEVCMPLEAGGSFCQNTN